MIIFHEMVIKLCVYTQIDLHVNVRMFNIFLVKR